MKKVLVTGASSFIAKHCLSELILSGYKTKGTLRSINKADQIKKDLEHHLEQSINIEFSQADLCSDNGWDHAVEGCDIVMHVASPFTFKQPKDENDMIVPAKEGTLRVLNAAKKAAVHRIILTSSNAAIWFGNFDIKEYNETNWTNINHNLIDPYTKSKTMAENAAWDFVQKNEEMQLTAINPVAVWGPGIGDHLHATSLTYFKMIMKNEIPGVPRMKIPIVDVRDVAKMHVKSLETEAAIGKRFLLSEKEYWFLDIANELRFLGYNTPKRQIPNFMVKLMSIFDETMKPSIPYLGFDYRLITDQAKEILGFNPIDHNKTLKDTAEYIDSF